MERNDKATEKVVIMFKNNFNWDKDLLKSSSYNFITSIIDGVLSINNTPSDVVFFGGRKENIIAFLANVVKDCQYYHNLDYSVELDFDEDDFEYDPNIGQDENESGK